MIHQIALAAVVTWFVLWWEHWFPWQALLRCKLPRVAAYVLGTLAMVLPLSVLYLHWIAQRPGWEYAHLAALWAVIVAGGLAVMSAYGIDKAILWAIGLVERNERLSLRGGDGDEGSSKQ